MVRQLASALLLTVGMLAGAAPGPALAEAQPQPPPLASPAEPLVLRYSVDVPLGELRAHPPALAILQREVPQIVNSSKVPDEVSLRALVAVAPQLVAPDKMRRIDAALRALPRS